MEKSIVKSEAGIVLDSNFEARLLEVENALSVLKNIQQDLRNMLLEEMRESGVVKVDTEKVTVWYVSPSDKESFDSKKFREDLPKVYDSYVTMKKVKDSVRVKVK